MKSASNLARTEDDDLKAAGWQQRPDPNRWLESIEQAIGSMVATWPLAPASRLTIEGSDFGLEDEIIAASIQAEGESQPVERAMRGAPLERLYHTKKNPIAPYQYLTGCKFRMDWHMAQISPLGAIDYSQSAVYLTEATLKQMREGYTAGIDGPALAATLRGVKPTPDNRLDAQGRIGDVLRVLSPVSSWLILKVVGYEWTLATCARLLNRDDRYIRQRMEEALDELARHYGMLSQARGKPAR